MVKVGLPSRKPCLLNPLSESQISWADVFRKGSIYFIRKAMQ